MLASFLGFIDINDRFPECKTRVNGDVLGSFIGRPSVKQLAACVSQSSGL